VSDYKLVAGLLNLEMMWGEPWSMSIVVNRLLTGFTHYAAIVFPNSNELEMTIESVVNNPEVGKTRINFSLTDAQAETLPQGELYWYYKWTPPDLLDRTILAGDVIVDKMVRMP
jgi:hypothetical protein